MPDKGSTRKSDPDLSEILDSILSGRDREDFLGKVERLLNAASDVLSDITPEKPKGAADGRSFVDTIGVILTAAVDQPETLARHWGSFAGSLLKVLRQQSDLMPDPADRRFRDDLWQESPLLRCLMQAYLAWEDHLGAWADDQEFTEEDRRRVGFIFDQMVAALAPTNLPINPVALKRAEKSAGMSAVAGIKNFIHDVRYNRAMPRQINPGAYRIGVDLATTPGAVVLRTTEMELLQYGPQTEKVRDRPLLLIPPQINKYYAFDLKPKNSILGYLVRQGFQVFTISWKNPDKGTSDWSIETYLGSIRQAVDAIRVITQNERINLISACAGGLTAMAFLGHLAETKDPIIESHSLLVTALLPQSGSMLELFTTDQTLELAREISRAEGTLDGKDLAHVFAWLRPGDLIWTYWVNNYMLGRQPPPLDVLYWDNDPTRLPAALHSDFIDMYQNDVFQRPGSQSLFGKPIDYANMQVDTYFVGGREDYLMPWQSIYRAARLFDGQHRFVLSTSGHVQSILRPPNLANTEYFTNADLPECSDQWLAEADRQDGTWWVDWTEWLNQRSGKVRPAPNRLGSSQYMPLDPAPGIYVTERMDFH
ncbi:MAG: alpha/beta fold hydrolase [Pseudomonadota bacterium]